MENFNNIAASKFSMVSVTLTPGLRKGVKYECIAGPGGSCDGHCCWGDGSIYLYAEDIERFLDFFKIDLDTFLEQHVIAEDAPCHHIKTKIMVPSLMLKETKERAACHFQDAEHGYCAVYKVRPFQCVGYPFWNMNTKSKMAWEKVVSFCPGAKDAPTMPGAKLYPAKEIRRLVREEQKQETEWEQAMIDWGCDYKSYLKDWLDKSHHT